MNKDFFDIKDKDARTAKIFESEYLRYGSINPDAEFAMSQLAEFLKRFGSLTDSMHRRFDRMMNQIEDKWHPGERDKRIVRGEQLLASDAVEAVMTSTPRGHQKNLH